MGKKQKKLAQQQRNILYFDHREKARFAKKVEHIATTFDFIPHIQPGFVTTLLFASILIASVAAEAHRLDLKTTNQQNQNQATPEPIATGNSTTDATLVESLDSYDFSGTNTFTKSNTTKLEQLSTNKIRELIDSKLDYDKSIVTHEQKQNCSRIKEKIVSTIKRLPASKFSIVSTFQSEKFRLKCVSEKLLRQITGNKEILMAFNPESHRPHIYYSPNEHGIDAIEISHEFMHSSTFFLHRSPICHTDSFHAPIPVWPITSENIKTYNESFDLGDKRIIKFDELRLKQKMAMKLTANEQSLLLKYSHASMDCLSGRFVDQVTDDVFKRFQNLPKPVIGIHPSYHEKMRIFNIFYNPEIKSYQAEMESFDPAFSVIMCQKRINPILKHFSYYTTNPDHFISEREAFSLAHLSEVARETFYPEANALRKKFIQRCL